jgi:hypothetical protein
VGIYSNETAAACAAQYGRQRTTILGFRTEIEVDRQDFEILRGSMPREQPPNSIMLGDA